MFHGSWSKGRHTSGASQINEVEDIAGAARGLAVEENGASARSVGATAATTAATAASTVIAAASTGLDGLGRRGQGHGGHDGDDDGGVLHFGFLELGMDVWVLRSEKMDEAAA